MMVGLFIVKRLKVVNLMGVLFSWVRKVVIYIGNNMFSYCNICVKDKEFFQELINFNLFKFKFYVVVFLSFICVNGIK